MSGILMSSISNIAAPRSRGSGADSGNLYVFTTFTFTNANTSGNTGPNLSTFLANYNTVTYPWLSNASFFTASNGIQTWTVPTTGTYRIVAKGAQGAPYSASAGGVGAVIQGDFALTQGETIKILVGQTARPPAARAGRNGSGGGGTFVVKSNVSTPSTADILVIAGGGGGCGTAFVANANASITANGRNASGSSIYNGIGGTGGNGGGQSAGATVNGAGGGFIGNGASNSATAAGGRAYIFGGNGGVVSATYAPEGGGFGGGGAPGNGDFNRMGGGGGYSGGGASDAIGTTATSTLAGGGGGSYNNGTNQINATDSSGNFGNGSVIVTFIG
jgi:hypothetical protein